MYQIVCKCSGLNKVLLHVGFYSGIMSSWNVVDVDDAVNVALVIFEGRELRTTISSPNESGQCVILSAPCCLYLLAWNPELCYGV